MAENSTPEPEPGKCPTCGKPVDPKAPAVPFCSKRCRLVDLGRWFKGDYKISRPIEQTDMDED